jgi:hypothetical protein
VEGGNTECAGCAADVRMHIARTCLEFESEKPLNIIPPDKEDEDQDEEEEEGVEAPEHAEEEEQEL